MLFRSGSNELLKDTKVIITEVATGQTATIKANPETGECSTNLIIGKQYKVVVSSDFCEDNEQVFTKTDDMSNISVKLIPKKISTVNLIALNVETGENVEADFVVTSEKTGKIYKAEKVKAKDGFSFKLSQNDNLKVEVTSEEIGRAHV